MKWRNEHHHELPHERDDLFTELSRPVGAPDLTRSIMGRLGYMRVDPAVARRNRIRRWAGRAAVLTMVLVTIIGGIAVFNQSDAVRRPHEVTIPSAIGQDVELHHQRFNTFLQVLQNSTPDHESPHLSPVVPVSTDKPSMTLPALELQRDETGEEDREGRIGEQSSDVFDEPLDDVEHPAIAPVRWV